MNYLKSLSILVLALILQQTVVRIISIGSIQPDLVIVALVAIAMRYGTLTGLFCGLTINLIQNVYAIETLKTNTLSKYMIRKRKSMA